MGNQDRKIASLEKHLKALQMRKDGISYTEIAAACGYKSAAAAFNAVKAALAESMREPTEQVRDMELARLDELYSAGTEILKREHLLVSGGRIVKDGKKKLTSADPAIKVLGALVRIMERRSALLGLDAPKKTDLTSNGKTLSWKEFISNDDQQPGADSE